MNYWEVRAYKLLGPYCLMSRTVHVSFDWGYIAKSLQTLRTVSSENAFLLEGPQKGPTESNNRKILRLWLGAVEGRTLQYPELFF